MIRLFLMDLCPTSLLTSRIPRSIYLLQKSGGRGLYIGRRDFGGKVGRAMCSYACASLLYDEGESSLNDYGISVNPLCQ